MSREPYTKYPPDIPGRGWNWGCIAVLVACLAFWIGVAFLLSVVT